MGPRFFSAEGILLVGCVANLKTFNGAALLQRGRPPASQPRYAKPDSLQWGRASSARKALGTAGNNTILIYLQWGRASSARKAHILDNGRAAMVHLQWGRASSARKAAQAKWRNYADIYLQWGRASSARKAISWIMAVRLWLTFNGAALLQRGRHDLR